MKKYFKPISDVYAISTFANVMDNIVTGSTIGPDGPEIEGDSKGDSGDWEDDDDLDGGSAIW